MNPTSSLRSANKASLHQAIVQQRISTLLAMGPISGERWLGPCLPIVNPPLWELGHVGWFQERWCLRERPGQPPGPSVTPTSDSHYHSTPVEHSTRWQLALMVPAKVQVYLNHVMEQSLARLDALAEDDPAVYFHRLSLFHEMMHRESFCYAWQTHRYQKPVDLQDPRALPPRDWLSVPEGPVAVGSSKSSTFVFDNEKWTTHKDVEAFQVSNRVVSNGEFAEFIQDGGYQNPSFWPNEVWEQMQTDSCKLPCYWRRDSGQFQVRQFHVWNAMQPDLPMTHVSLHEANAWCGWAGLALPTEAQWLAAANLPDFQWGDVWEWTTSPFEPFHGFSEDPYKEYSSPWFHTHQVLKGASYATPDGLRDPQFRNYFSPERRDLFNGFRVVRSI